MTLAQILHKARNILKASNIEDAALVSELLLRHVLNIERVQLYLALDKNLAEKDEGVFWSLLERAAEGEPAAYLTGHRHFYGLDFYVNSHVLIPRPETELLVEATVRLASNYRAPLIADIGTGPGIIAISLVKEIPDAKIHAIDISAPALEIALRNLLKHGVTDRVHLLQGDLLEPLPEPVDIIVANLPYVKPAELAGVPLKFEPRIALDGGTDGLEVIRRLCRQAPAKLKPNGTLLLEVGQGQSKQVISLLHMVSPLGEIDITTDLNGIERVISITLIREPARNAICSPTQGRKNIILNHLNKPDIVNIRQCQGIFTDFDSQPVAIWRKYI